jgi:hypothetical protein
MKRKNSFDAGVILLMILLMPFAILKELLKPYK